MRAIITASAFVLAALPHFAAAQTQVHGELPPPIMQDTESPAATRIHISDDFVPVPAVPTTESAPGVQASLGSWIFTRERGYIWIPEGSVARVVLGVPAAFLYTPEAGWAWYASPWGEGPLQYGSWISRPWTGGVRTLSRTGEGWAWSANASHATAAARFFGSPGHFYDPAVDVMSEREASAKAVKGVHSEGAHAASGSRNTRQSSGGRAARR